MEKANEPSWLNNSFLETALRSSEDDNLQVTSYEVSRATAAGDNYSSEMLRVKVTFTRNGQSQTRSVILKAEPTSGEMAKLVSKSGVFLRESTALAKTVPKIHSLIQEKTKDRVPLFTAECLYSHIGHPGSVIVLEDLKAAGFRMAERTEGLDKDHCLLVLRTLAKYHATSAVLYKRDPELFGSLCKSLYDEKSTKTVLEPFYENGVKNVAKEMRKWPEFDARYSEKLEKVSQVAVAYLIQAGKEKDGDFNVLNHGDLWLNNLMFRYSDTTGKVEEVRFVDLPMGNIGTPALDLQYFLHTSLSLDLMNQHGQLLEEYYKTLVDTFTLLNQKHMQPTLQQLQKQVDYMGMYAVIMACSLYPLVLSDRTDIPDLDKIWNNEQGISYSQRYRNALKVLFPIFEEKGWLNAENFSTV